MREKRAVMKCLIDRECLIERDIEHKGHSSKDLKGEFQWKVFD